MERPQMPQHTLEREIQKESKRKLNFIVAQLVNLHCPFCTLVTNCLFFSIHICTKDGIAFNQPTFAGEVLSNFDRRVWDRRGLEKINATSSKSGVGGFLIFEKFNTVIIYLQQDNGFLRAANRCREIRTVPEH